jgi:hypothetical protein
MRHWFSHSARFSFILKLFALFCLPFGSDALSQDFYQHSVSTCNLSVHVQTISPPSSPSAWLQLMCMYRNEIRQSYQYGRVWYGDHFVTSESLWHLPIEYEVIPWVEGYSIILVVVLEVQFLLVLSAKWRNWCIHNMGQSSERLIEMYLRYISQEHLNIFIVLISF